MPASNTSNGNYLQPQDKAKTTHKENNLFSYTGTATAEVEACPDYSAIHTKEKQYFNLLDYTGTKGMNTKSKVDMVQYDNMFINTNRETIDDRKGYTSGGQKPNMAIDSSDVNIYMRDDNLRKSKYNGANVNRVFGNGTINDRYTNSIGDVLVTDGKTSDIKDDRLQSYIVEAFKNNPYTQPLDSI